MKGSFVNQAQFKSLEQFSFRLDSRACIGNGSFGSVYLGMHKASGKLYALKVFKSERNKPEEQQLIKREIKIHSQLDHPHIVKLWGVMGTEGQPIMILQFIENGNLYNYLSKRKKLSQKEIFKFFAQTARALDYMHSRNYIHRDIKPQNLLLDQANNLKLCDMGWSVKGINTPHSTFCGTYQYMSPQILTQISYDFRVDIWSLGILLYELSHSRAPFRGQSKEAVKQSLIRGEYEIDKTLSPDLRKLIKLILQFNPAKRPSLKEILAHPWSLQMLNQIQNDFFSFLPASPTTTQDNNKRTATLAQSKPLSLKRQHYLQTEPALECQTKLETVKGEKVKFKKKGLKRCDTLADSVCLNVNRKMVSLSPEERGKGVKQKRGRKGLKKGSLQALFEKRQF